MFIHLITSVFFATGVLIAGEEPLPGRPNPAEHLLEQQGRNGQALQPRDLNQLPQEEFQALLSKALSANSDRSRAVRELASAQSVCSIPLLEIKVKNTNGFGKDTMKTPRTFDRIVGATPAPACKAP